MNAEQLIRSVLPPPANPQDEADIRQLSHTAASTASIFITRDSKLLKYADAINKAVGISVLRPAELISEFDELRRARDYQPVRTAGSTVRNRLGTTTDVKACESLLAPGERLRDFRSLMSGFMSRPEECRVDVFEDQQRAVLGLCVTDQQAAGRIEVPVLRVAESRLAGTLLRKILQIAIGRASKLGLVVSVTDAFASRAAYDAMDELGFLQLGDENVRVALHSIDDSIATASRLSGYLKRVGINGNAGGQIIESLGAGRAAADTALASEIEHLLWPAILRDCEIPTFVVPIQAGWAYHLFDERIANQSLFGALEHLALNPESVYYRSARQNILSAPGRILWYVSKSDVYDGTMSIRACSRLDEIVIDTPKRLFARFKRLGIYEWQEVFATANNDVEKEIMAIRFSDTQALQRPLPLSEVRSILEQDTVRTNNFVSPVRIPQHTFVRLMEAGNSYDVS